MGTQSLDSVLPVHTTDRLLFKKCRLAWHFASNLRLNLEPVRVPRALDFGTAYHAGLAAFYAPDTPRDPRLAQDGFSAALRGSYDLVGGDEAASVEAEEQYHDDLALGLGMLDHYADWARMQDQFTVIWVERAYLVPIPGMEPYVYGFKPDGLVMDYEGRYWILEHKTAARFDDYYDYLLRDDQCGSYIWGLKQAEGIEVEGVIYTESRKHVPTPMPVLKNGGLSVDKRRDTTYAYARQQIVDYHGSESALPVYADFLTHLVEKGNTFFHREMVRRTRNEVAALGKAITFEVQDMIEPLIYRNPTRGNCYNCPFQTPCLIYYEGGDLEAVLKMNYKQREG